MSRNDLQLPLLEVAPFAAGPARAPRPRRLPRIAISTLALPFGERPAPPPAARPTPAASAEPEPAQQPEERLLCGSRRLGSIERARVEAAFEAAFDAALRSGRRRQALLVREGADTLELSVETDGVRARFSGRRAANRWLVEVQRVGREHGLVEPD